jgi:hypothetical protein
MLGDGNFDMEDIPWYSEASLRAPGKVFCAGSLAQCVRKWSRLPEIDQASAYIKLASQFEGQMKLGREDVVRLASSNELSKV